MPEPSRWVDVATELRNAINAGRYQPGDQLPSQAQLITTHGVARQTLQRAIEALRTEGLITTRPGLGWFVRERPAVVRLARHRLSRAERDAGRGFFLSDALAGGWAAEVDVSVRTEPATADVAGELELDEGAEVLLRQRSMRANGDVVQLATSYLPRALTRGTAIEQENSGPGGIYARLEDAGHQLTHYQERVAAGPPTAAEREQFTEPTPATVFRIVRTAYSTTGPIEVNFITARADRFELIYELTAE